MIPMRTTRPNALDAVLDLALYPRVAAPTTPSPAGAGHG